MNPVELLVKVISDILQQTGKNEITLTGEGERGIVTIKAELEPYPVPENIIPFPTTKH